MQLLLLVCCLLCLTFPLQTAPPAVRIELPRLDPARFRDESDRLHYQGFKRIPSQKPSNPDEESTPSEPTTWETPEPFPSATLTAIDDAVGRFMARHKAPGLSFAIAYDGRLILARTYGFADLEKREPLAPRHRFRIASISKPITAVGVLRLHERHSLRMTSKVFGPGALLGAPSNPAPDGPPLSGITIEHLLHHTAGGWAQDLGFDPMFHHTDLGQPDLISHVLRTRPLQREPGAEHHYSNFGYCLLGRVIEATSIRPYERFIQAEVLAPCGITRMEIGRDTEAERKPDEVKYYGQQGENPYGMKLARMDSHGGWIANAIDLVRFLVHVDQRPSKLDLLKPESLALLFKPSTASPGYALGWAVNSVSNHWHSGSLPGSQSIAVQTHDGFCWAALTNTRDDRIGADLDPLMWEIRKTLTSIPSFDLFR
jgi:CubicO group peptidase (beta-lactamase class C family)